MAKAKDFLQNLIREKDMLPKPTLDIDMAEFRHMRNLMIKAQDKAAEIKHLQDEVLPKLKSAACRSTKEYSKAKSVKVVTEAKIRADRKENMLRSWIKLPYVLKKDGYPDVQAFMRIFREMESVVEQYNRDLVEWEYQSRRKSDSRQQRTAQTARKAECTQTSARDTGYSERNTDKSHRKKSFDRDSQIGIEKTPLWCYP